MILVNYDEMWNLLKEYLQNLDGQYQNSSNTISDLVHICHKYGVPSHLHDILREEFINFISSNFTLTQLELTTNNLDESMPFEGLFQNEWGGNSNIELPIYIKNKQLRFINKNSNIEIGIDLAALENLGIAKVYDSSEYRYNANIPIDEIFEKLKSRLHDWFIKNHSEYVFNIFYNPEELLKICKNIKFEGSNWEQERFKLLDIRDFIQYHHKEFFNQHPEYYGFFRIKVLLNSFIKEALSHLTEYGIITPKINIMKGIISFNMERWVETKDTEVQVKRIPRNEKF